MSALPLPRGLAVTVEQIIDRALARRPDLAGASPISAPVKRPQKRARADFWPTLSFLGIRQSQAPVTRYLGAPRTSRERARLRGVPQRRLSLFDGFARRTRARGPGAPRHAPPPSASSELRAVREVWKAYADVKTALAKHEFALALLAASEKAYAATFESYQRAGLATVLDLLAATRDLASARSIALASRAELLTASANLAFAAGD